MVTVADWVVVKGAAWGGVRAEGWVEVTVGGWVEEVGAGWVVVREGAVGEEMVEEKVVGAWVVVGLEVG